MYILSTGATFAAALLVAGGVNAASVYTDQSEFSALPGVTTIDTFDDEVATDTTITFKSGVTATKSSDGVPATLNRVKFDKYTGHVKRDDFRTITLDFGSEITGFGADFSGLSSLMVTGNFDGVNETVSIFDAVGANGFFGLTSTTGFQTVTFTTNSGGYFGNSTTPFGGETFSFDNLATTDAVTAPAVPLPAGGMLLISALAGAGLMRRKKSA